LTRMTRKTETDEEFEQLFKEQERTKKKKEEDKKEDEEEVIDLSNAGDV
jgi:hypothetical protein